MATHCGAASARRDSGSARVSRVGFGVLPKQALQKLSKRWSFGARSIFSCHPERKRGTSPTLFAAPKVV